MPEKNTSERNEIGEAVVDKKVRRRRRTVITYSREEKQLSHKSKWDFRLGVRDESRKNEKQGPRKASGVLE